MFINRFNAIFQLIIIAGFLIGGCSDKGVTMMNETEQYIGDSVKIWIWSGFYDLDEINEMMEEMIEDEGGDCDDDTLRRYAINEWKRKQGEEKTWPEITDCDRLDDVFEELNSQGIIALQNAGYTMSDGLDEVGERLESLGRNKIKGYCFYHEQDLERAVTDSYLLLAFGDMNGIDTQKIKIGNMIIKVLKEHGFEYEWDGTATSRIQITNLKWQRRYSAS